MDLNKLKDLYEFIDNLEPYSIITYSDIAPIIDYKNYSILKKYVEQLYTTYDDMKYKLKINYHNNKLYFVRMIK